MPMYDYRCSHCGLKFEVSQSMSEGPLEHCIECDGPVRRLLGSGIQITLGPGFSTKTDALKAEKISFRNEQEAKESFRNKKSVLISNEEANQEFSLIKKRKEESHKRDFDKFFNNKKQELLSKWNTD